MLYVEHIPQADALKRAWRRGRVVDATAAAGRREGVEEVLADETGGVGEAEPEGDRGPDPASSFIWRLPIEIDPETVAPLQIANENIVRVESPEGYSEAPAYVHPAAVPGVVSFT